MMWLTGVAQSHIGKNGTREHTYTSPGRTTQKLYCILYYCVNRNYLFFPQPKACNHYTRLFAFGLV